MDRVGQRRLNILLSAYACEPGLGSEPGVGWNWVEQLSRDHNLWVLTAAEQRSAIEAVSEALPNIHWLFVELPGWLIFWKKGQRGRRLHYGLWQLWAYFAGKAASRRIQFDIIQHVTFVSYWTPSYLALLPVPFVWGPVGAAESTPRSFYPTLSLRARLNERLRDLVRWLADAFDPFLRLTARRACIGLATTEETASKLRQLGTRQVKVLSESALSQTEIDELGKIEVHDASQPIRFISMGRLIGWKGYHLSLMAFAAIQHEFPAAEYWIVGGGGEQQRLERLAQDLGVGARVCFWGRVARQQALECLAQADILVHPSLHDSGGWVCLEAMAAGRPVICLMLGGPAVQVTDATGIRVAALTPAQTVADLSQAMRRLATEPALRHSMSAAGRARVRTHFNWAQKGQQMAQIYDEVLAACDSESWSTHPSIVFDHDEDRGI